MAGNAITAVAAIDLEDPSPFDESTDRLWGVFEPALKTVAQGYSFPAEVLGVEALLRSPHGVTPVRFTVELTLRGDSWSALRETANQVVSLAARECGFGVAEPDGSMSDESSYEQQGTQLVPA